MSSPSDNRPIPGRGNDELRESTSRRLSNVFGSFRGPNSIDHFASSYQRAQSFRNIDAPLSNIITKSRSFFDDEDEIIDPNNLVPSSYGRHLSTVLQHRPSIRSQRLPDDESFLDSNVIDENSLYDFRNSVTQNSITRYITNESNEEIAIPVKIVEQPDGTVVTVLAGQSTVPQTIFNSVNVLVGIGLLALPLGLKYAGWFGLPLLALCACGTYYTAGLLAKCLDTDNTLVTYADIGYAAFGPKARIIISILFSIDLLGAGVSLIILFADSLNALFPSISTTTFKIIAFFILTPPSFLSLNILSFFSLFGISSVLTLILLVGFCGLTKVDQPGSLIDIKETWFFPQSWGNIPIAIGLLMAPWGGHAIFPNIYRDMRHPNKYYESLKVTYSVTFFTDASMAVLGFLMFGNTVKDEVTKSILITKGYPNFIYGLISALIAIIPVAKTPLNARPIISTLEILFGLNKKAIDDKNNNVIEEDSINETSLLTSQNKKKQFKLTKNYFKTFLDIFIKLFVNFLFIFLAILFPDFEKIIALLGSSICFLICMILPLSFYLKIYHGQISKIETIFCYVLIVISVILGTIGTVYAIL